MDLKKKISTLMVLLVIISINGCGAHLAKRVENNILEGKYNEALQAIEEGKQHYAGPNSLLYYLDRGALLQRVGKYKESNQELHQAELLVEKLYGKSVTETAASLLANDTTMAYTGEDFEQVMIHVIKELNYLYLQDKAGALVEARKVNTRLLQVSDKYGKEAIYKEDAFARYLAAFAYESDREYNSAYIDYKKAYQVFKWYEKKYGFSIPYVIKQDLLRMSRWLGFTEEYTKWCKEFGQDIPKPTRRPQKREELLLIVYDGLIAKKETFYITESITNPDGEPYLLRVALPVMKTKPNVVQKVRLGSSEGKVYESELIEPLNTIALQNLGQRIGLITAKAIARATTKYLASYALRKASEAARKKSEKSNTANVLGVMSLAANIYGYASEQADTRSWRTLPQQFHILRVVLSPGKHELELRIVARGNEVRPGQKIRVELKEGEKKIMPLYVPN